MGRRQRRSARETRPGIFAVALSFADETLIVVAGPTKMLLSVLSAANMLSAAGNSRSACQRGYRPSGCIKRWGRSAIAAHGRWAS